ncbi:hypothetical protein [Enterobacter hormaechei]|uniref:hypothetical protein n=3 Tax=Enterobacter hormaechei TaxID=158836 RepID=UPI001BD1DCBB|nr:hypothetical protein [Enterobacter hormaechei]
MINESELKKFIGKLDKGFDSDRIAIPHRIGRCLAEVSKKYNINLPIFCSIDKKSFNEPYRITYIVQEWYKERYGNRLHTSYDIGFILLLLRGQVLICRVPNFFGECNFFIDQDLDTKKNMNETNILEMIEGITQDFANSLTEKEQSYIFSSFQKGSKAAIIISDWRYSNLEMIKAAINDLEGIKNNFILNQPHLANSKWAYNQFVEKILKSWLLKTGSTRPELQDKGHKLISLVRLFNENYQNEIDESKIPAIIGKPSLRYDEIEVTNEELINVQDCIFDIILQIGSSPKSLKQ